MKNILKKNKKGMSPGILLVIILAIVLVGGGALWATGTLGGGTTQAVTTGITDQSECADATGILTANVVSALAKGTAVGTPTITAGINGGIVGTSVTSGETTFPVGANVEVLASKSDYIDDSFSFIMPCGGYTLEAPIYYSTSDNPSIRAKNDDGDYMEDSNGAIVHDGVNQTNVAVGEVIKWDIEFSGTSLESSGDGLFIVEFDASSGANITKVELGGATIGSLPSVHTTANAGSKVSVFNVPAVVGSAKEVHTLTITLGATKDLEGNISMTWYGKQEFIDDDGTIQVGVEDQDGTAQYENKIDYHIRVETTAGE